MFYPQKLTAKQMREKRMLDITVTILLLPVIIPLTVIISTIIIIKDGFPVFINQERLTYNGKKFYIYKF